MARTKMRLGANILPVSASVEINRHLDELEAENARFREALEKLADEKNLIWTGIIVQEFAQSILEVKE